MTTFKGLQEVTTCMDLRTTRNSYEADFDGMFQTLPSLLFDDPTKADSDDDGLSDGQEFELGTQLRLTLTVTTSDGQEVSSYNCRFYRRLYYRWTQSTNGWISGYQIHTADGGGDDYDSANDFIAFDKDSDWK